MRFALFTCTLAGVLLLGTSGCSGQSESSKLTDAGGSGSGGSGGSAQGGSSEHGGSQASGGPNAGTAGGSSAGNAGSSSAGNAGSSSAGSSSGGTGNRPDCDKAFRAFDKSCSSAADCVLLDRQVNCCGTMLVMGLNSSEQAAFTALERTCSAQFPACGCAAQGKQLEDGSSIDFAASAVADCIEGRCLSRSVAVHTCGQQACAAGQYCEEFVGGVACSVPSYNCLPLGDCHDCACLKGVATVVACQCMQTASGIQVFCAAP